MITSSRTVLVTLEPPESVIKFALPCPAVEHNAQVLLPGDKLKSQADIDRVSLNDSVRVATVDNFQGEESTIIILSLVRNNK